MIALIANFLLAIIWLMLSQEPTIATFIIGYLISFALIALFSKVLGGRAYVRRTSYFLRFLLLFSREFIIANLQVAWLVLAVPKHKFRSGFVNYSIAHMTFNEALLLSHCITLTPGTITTAFDWDNQLIRVHILDFSTSTTFHENTDQKFKHAIWKFSR